MKEKEKILIVVNVDWFFLSHRLPIALAAIGAGYEVHIATAITDKLEALQGYGLIVHQLALDRSSSGLFSSLKAIWGIYSVVRRIRPHVVHLVTIKPVIFGGIAARLAGSPAVVVAISGLGHVFSSSGRVASLRRLVAIGLYRLALGNKKVAVIFQNDNDRRILSSRIDLAHVAVHLIPGSGVDLSEYVSQPLSEGTTTIMLVARLIADKGVREFAEASRILGRRNLRFVLVGNVDQSNPTSLTQREIDVFVRDGLVEHWGYRADITGAMAEAHMVVLPSYYGEGLPKVLIEAAACGRAVITTDHPGCRDAIEENMSGILVPVRDAKALASAIAYLADNPEICRDMGIEGRRIAEQKYDVGKVVATHMQIYADLIDR